MSRPSCRTTEFLCKRMGRFPQALLNSYRMFSLNIKAAETSVWQLTSSQSHVLTMCAADLENSAVLNMSNFSYVVSAVIITLPRLIEELIYLIECLCFSPKMDSSIFSCPCCAVPWKGAHNILPPSAYNMSVTTPLNGIEWGVEMYQMASGVQQRSYEKYTSYHQLK
jgi:hypothetical protein